MSENKTVRIYGTADDSIVDGSGIRFAIFTQGCKHACPGCHNPKAHSFSGGVAVSVESLWQRIDSNRLLAGITLTGGEPFERAAELIELSRRARAKGLNVWAYSGYLFEQLSAGTPSPAAAELLKEVDVLVDGPFKQELQSYELRWRGSSNQRIIDVAASLAAGEVVEATLS
ncbi:MAG TPA: anaerobic ribonucleoside-triphosphate reductase activating protein [Coriobacteriia bacterium]|nr:anaerobic ribonucleoside-triphosphate reductase activating protein [Coriobacteriia bacterium]